MAVYLTRRTTQQGCGQDLQIIPRSKPAHLHMQQQSPRNAAGSASSSAPAGWRQCRSPLRLVACRSAGTEGAKTLNLAHVAPQVGDAAEERRDRRKVRQLMSVTEATPLTQALGLLLQVSCGRPCRRGTLYCAKPACSEARLGARLDAFPWAHSSLLPTSVDTTASLNTNACICRVHISMTCLLTPSQAWVSALPVLDDRDGLVDIYTKKRAQVLALSASLSRLTDILAGGGVGAAGAR